MIDKVWNIPPAVPIPEKLVEAGCTPLLAAILAARGVDTEAEAAAFLTDGALDLADPMELTDMEAAAARIVRAGTRRETVAVYGDYDVDGITAACLLTEAFRDMGLHTETYIPDRLEEGYGLNIGAIDKLRARGVSLIVTVDCGITAVEETEYAKSMGIDMIITDHHECQAELPHAVAVVNPKRPDCPYPNRDLAGVGVAFKVACALAGDGETAMLDRYADLVAVGTIADVMSLTGENRRMVRAGLEKLRTAPRPGLAALLEEAGAGEGRLGASTVGFTLAPRINAAGRLGRTELATKLILEREPDRAHKLAEELCAMNRKRQQMEAAIWDEAAQMLSGQAAPTGPIVLAREGWHQGVIGIVASRLTEAYRVPAIMISMEGDKGKGSCRSWGGFNLFEALAACDEALESFGGHALAAGLNIHADRIDEFRALLEEYYANHIPRETEGVSIDVTVDSPALLTMQCVESLDVLEPFGNGNPKPVLCLLDAALTAVTPIGGGKHVRLRLEKFGQSYDCVWFGRRSAELGAVQGDRVDAAFYPQISEFRGRRSVQLVMTDLRRTDTAVLCRNILEGASAGGAHLTRTELGWLWRALTGPCPGRWSLSCMEQIEPRLQPTQIALGLRVLAELDLAGLRIEGQDVFITLNAWEVKADLNQSPSWQAQQR